MQEKEGSEIYGLFVEKVYFGGFYIRKECNFSE